MATVPFAFRQLWKHPGFTTVTVLTLAVGIGATVAIYSAVQTTIIDPLPVPDPDRLMMVESFNTKKERFKAAISPLTIRRLRQEKQVFAELTIFDVMRAMKINPMEAPRDQ